MSQIFHVLPNHSLHVPNLVSLESHMEAQEAIIAERDKGGLLSSPSNLHFSLPELEKPSGSNMVDAS